MKRTARAIVRGLSIVAIIPLWLRMVGVDLGIDLEDLTVLVCPPLFLAFGIAIWFDPLESHRKGLRILVWVLTIFSLWAWGLMPLNHRIPNKAILILSASVLLVVSEWRYARFDAANHVPGTLEGTSQTTKKN